MTTTAAPTSQPVRLQQRLQQIMARLDVLLAADRTSWTDGEVAEAESLSEERDRLLAAGITPAPAPKPKPAPPRPPRYCPQPDNVSDGVLAFNAQLYARGAVDLVCEWFLFGRQNVIVGFAATWVVADYSYDCGNGRRERIAGLSAFEKSLEPEAQPIRAMIDHDPCKIVGSTAKKNLKLWADDVGLLFRLYPENTANGHALVEALRFYGAGMSFGGKTIRAHTEQSAEHGSVEVIDEFKLEEITVALSAQPANLTAMVALASDLRAPHRLARDPVTKALKEMAGKYK